MITKSGRPLLFWIFLSSAIFVFLTACLLTFSHYGRPTLAFDQFTPVKHQATIKHSPTTLQIPRLKIILPVESQEVKTAIWPETERGVTFVKESAVPGEKGNSIFYGHNWSNLLGKLPKARIGDDVIITMDNGETKKFVITKTMIVSPTDTEVLDDADFSKLTIFTCTGLLDSERFVVFARLAS